MSASGLPTRLADEQGCHHVHCGDMVLGPPGVNVLKIIFEGQGILILSPGIKQGLHLAAHPVMFGLVDKKGRKTEGLHELFFSRKMLCHMGLELINEAGQSSGIGFFCFKGTDMFKQIVDNFHFVQVCVIHLVEGNDRYVGFVDQHKGLYLRQQAEYYREAYKVHERKMH